ncbi:transglycosylase family protein [Pseudonocardia yunnanensis]|uniref:Transglycosylase family protein n=1 Tax=Pseudonocardia yunnanensis TaxID=58107 RepID=A0ABW4EZC6_9PSEU
MAWFGEQQMTSRPDSRKGRSLLRLAVAGAVAVGVPIAVAGTANAAPDNVWDRVAQCESGGNWKINTGNGFSGGLQFTPSTWRAFGGTGSAHQASREQQIAVAERVLAAQGWNAWPVCSKKAGARSYTSQTRAVHTSQQVQIKPAPAEAKAPVKKAAPVAEHTSAPRLTKNGADYTVVKGDTLSAIAADRQLQGGWPALFERNKDVLTNPNVIQIGQQLDLA